MEETIEKAGYEFMWNSHHGFVLSCPSNLGTGLRASVHLIIPNLCKHPKFMDIVNELRLQKRGTGGEHSAEEEGIFDMSNIGP